MSRTPASQLSISATPAVSVGNVPSSRLGQSVRPSSVRVTDVPPLSARRRVLDGRMPRDEDIPATSAPSAPPRTALAPRAAFAPSSRWVGRDRAGEPSESRAGSSSLSLSPRMTALFGGLFGLATVTTIIALLIQGAPPRDDRAAASSVVDPSAAVSAGSSPGAAAAAAPSGPKKRVRTKLPGPWRVADMSKDAGVKLVEDTIGTRSFIAALGEKGVPKDQVYRVLKAFDGIRKFDKTGKKDRFVVALDRKENAVRGFELIVSPTEVYQAKEVDGVLTAATLDFQLKEEEVVGSFYVGKNLTKSIEWGGLEPDLVRVIDEAFAGRFSHESLQEGGVVKVVATEVTALGDFVRYKNVIAVEYRTPDPAAPPMRAYTYFGTAAKGYFDEKGRQPDGGGWATPVPGAPITSKFNPKRMHPVLHKVMPHNGTDYGASTGTPVHAVFRGKLTHVGPAGPCGNMIAIMHPNGVESGYCHLHKIAPGLKVGGTIGTRQVIGQVGTTGRSTGPHLHFWTKKDGKFFDSETMKIDGFRVIPTDERSGFTARKALLDGRLDAIVMPEPPPVEAKASSTPDDDTKPQVGGSESDDDAPAKKAEPGSKKAPAAPAQVDPGDGEDLMGADLGK